MTSRPPHVQRQLKPSSPAIGRAKGVFSYWGDDPAVPANRKAWEVLMSWEKPFLTTFSDSDPVTKGGERAFQGRVPGTKGQPHTTIEGAGHFLQEDKGEELARIVVDFIAQTS